MKRHVVCLSIGVGEEAFINRSLAAITDNTDPSTPIAVCYAGRSEELLASLTPEIGWDAERMRVSCVEGAISDLFHASLDFVRNEYPGADIAYIRCGVDVPHAWDDRLAFSSGESTVATVSPLCDSSVLFQLVYENVTRAVASIDALLYGFSSLTTIQVPVPLESCLFIRRDALDAVWGDFRPPEFLGPGAFLLELTERLIQSGYVHVLCDHVYVRKYTDDVVQRNLEKACRPGVDTVNRRHPLTGLRHAFNDALQQNLEGHTAPRMPTQLHVVHGWGGGLEKWVTEFCRWDKNRWNLILRSSGTWGQFGQRLELFDNAELAYPIASWELQYPIQSIANSNLHYRRIVAEIIDAYGVEVIIVSSLIGHALEVLEASPKTVVVLHDYLPFCAAINIFFGIVCESCDTHRLARCFAENPHNRYFTHDSPDDWLATRKRFERIVLDRDICLVAPSPSVERHWKKLVPALAAKPFRIIPHGAAVVPKLKMRNVNGERRRLRMLILGSLAPNKGGELLKSTLPTVCELMDVFLVGCGREGDFFSGMRGISITPAFDRSDLQDIVTHIDPDMGLLASVVPETFSYTLSELLGFGIPPLAPNRGSFPDRIRDGETGFLYVPEPAALIDKLKGLDRAREEIDRVRSTLQISPAWAESDMIAEYHKLSPLPFFSAARYRRKGESVTDSVSQSRLVLSVSPGAKFSQVYREFGEYVAGKVIMSPRVSHWQRWILLRACGLIFGGRR